MSSSGTVQCFSCKENIDCTKFEKHNLDKHNMLSWKEGDPPLDLKNEKMILSILNKVLKSKKKKILSCDTCREEKKSALGFFTHKQVCGKSAQEVQQMRVTCDICGRSMMPVSFRPHMLVHERAAVQEQNPNLQEDSKTKRAAATKAQSRMVGAFSDAEFPPLKPSKKSKKVLSYTKLDSVLFDPSPKLLQAWKGVIESQGLVFCPYKDCNYEAYNVHEMKNHVSSCNGFSNHDMAFLCNWCLYQCKDESQVVMHIHSEHLDSGSDASGIESDSSSDDALNSDEDKGRKRNINRQKYSAPPRQFNKMKFLVNTSHGLSKDLDIYPSALQWTYEFRKANHSEYLYPLLHTWEKDWKYLHGIEADRYIPSTHKSVAIEVNSKGYQSPSNRYNRFESDVVDGVLTMFTGGPVWAMEWCPIPMKESLSNTSNCTEYLAVSSHRNMNDFYYAQTCYSSPNIIQIWDCGSLNNTQKEAPTAPKFALGLAHDFGTVWSLAWCPSGAFDKSVETKVNHQLRRLGLLSASCSDGTVRLFSVPFPDQLKCHTTKRALPIYKCSPSITLITNFPEPSQCTRVAWYQGKHHRLLAGGYTNGMIALWDLDNLVPLLWDANLKTLKPYHCFQAHFSVVTVSFCPEFDGRFMMTGSHDRTVKFWDLEDSSAPVSLHRRGLVTDGVWLGLWVSSVTSYDDAFLHEHTNSTLHPVRDFGYKPFPLLVQNSVAWSLSFNEWINAIAQGSEAGELVISFSNQLFQGIDNEKNVVARRVMLSYTLLKKLVVGNDGKENQGDVVTWKVTSSEGKGGKSKSSKSRKLAQSSEKVDGIPSGSTSSLEVKPRTYEDSIQSYGISLHDTIKGFASKNSIPTEASSRVRLSGRMHSVPSDLYPITSINKISWNPNISQFFWLASGHHCGLVRIISVHFMESPVVGRFLSEVAKEHSQVDE